MNTRAHRLLYSTAVRVVGEASLFQRIEELQGWQWEPPHSIRERQLTRLRSLLDHARGSVPYYRAGVPHESAPGAGHLLAGWPLLSKADLQECGAALRSTRAGGRLSLKTTGGSTGEAVTILKDREATAAERAAMWLGYGWFGVEPGDRVARFWGAPFATRRKWLVRAADFAMNRIRFSAFAFDEPDLERYWARCLRFRPAYLHGYVSMLTAFAAFLEARGEDGRRLPLKSIVATSEALTHPQRDLLQRVFGARVQVEYGCGEVGPIAYECPEGLLHLMADNLYVEVLREDGAPAETGEPGEIVLTDLTNYAMPLIRYRVGDFGVPADPCPCGRGYPTLREVWGRAYDFVIGPDGRRYHGEFFMYLFEDLRRGGFGVRQFKVEQVGETSLRILLLEPDGPNPLRHAQVLELVRSRLPGMSCAIESVAAIPRTASGKARVIENRWRQQGDGA